MRVERILQIDDDLGQQMLDLIETIDDEDMNVDAFIRYFTSSLNEIGVFGAFDDNGKLCSMVYLEPPTEIYPKRGYLFITVSLPGTRLEVSKAVFNAGNEWVISKGATYLWGWTARSPRAINRLYGFEVCKERQVVCPLVGDDHLKIKRDREYSK